jgi:hypothetical protein
MKTILVLPLLALVVFAAACGGSSGEASPPVTVTVTETETVTVTEEAAAPPAATEEPASQAAVDNGDLLLQYVPATDAALQEYQTVLADSGLMELIVEDVNSSIALPGDIIFSVEETGDPSPFYQPDPAAIVVPPEWLVLTDQVFLDAEVASTAEEQQDLVLAATAFVVYHEVGHMLVDQLDLPITGREEDAVDQLAVLVAAGEEDQEVAVQIATAGALFFGLIAANREAFDASDFWDEHSLNEQRFFNIICWFFGSDPEAYADLPAQAGLGEDRMIRCPDEFAQIQSSWTALLTPYLLG